MPEWTDRDIKLMADDIVDGAKPILPKPFPPPVMFYCSFCGKSNSAALKLVAGSNAFICNECVVMCYEIIGEETVLATRQKWEQTDASETQG